MYMPYIEDLGAEKPSAAADLGNRALRNSAHQSKQGRLPSQACQKLQTPPAQLSASGMLGAIGCLSEALCAEQNTKNRSQGKMARAEIGRGFYCSTGAPESQ